MQPLWEVVWQYIAKPNIMIPYDAAITFLGTYPVDLKCLNKYLLMIVYSNFIYNPTKPKCSSIGEWISKLLYIHTMAFYSGIATKSCKDTT